MTITEDLTDVYETILKLPEATNGSEIHLFVTKISDKRRRVFQKIREDQNYDRAWLLDEIKKISSQYAFRSVGGETIHRKTAHQHFKALNFDIKQLEFDMYKKEGTCNCELRKTIGLAFDDESLKNLNLLKHVTAAYDRYDVYQCHSCMERWVHEYLEDDDGSVRWVPWNAKDFSY